eukprot:3153828-Prymnesium_polylepis.2
MISAPLASSCARCPGTSSSAFLSCCSFWLVLAVLMMSAHGRTIGAGALPSTPAARAFSSRSSFCSRFFSAFWAATVAVLVAVLSDLSSSLSAVSCARTSSGTSWNSSAIGSPPSYAAKSSAAVTLGSKHFSRPPNFAARYNLSLPYESVGSSTSGVGSSTCTAAGSPSSMPFGWVTLRLAAWHTSWTLGLDP